MIPSLYFGRTGHRSTRIIFGGCALSQASQTEADRVLEVLLEYGINHIDTAPMYGNAEKCIGTWMERHRDNFFLATKTRKRGYKEAIDMSMQWALGLPESFLITAGDMRLLPKMLEAANRFEERPSDVEMSALVDEFGIEPIFS